MARLYASDVIVVLVVLLVLATGYYLYVQFFPHPGQATSSQNWAGYTDRQSVSWASGSIALPSPSEWNGSGVASLWVGMGGSNRGGLVQWPFWQAGVAVTCSSSVCTALLFDEGGTQGAPCNGTCAVNWTHEILYSTSATVSLRVSGGASGSVAVLSVEENGAVTTYDPPPWTVLAGVSSFPYAEWVLESPTGVNGAMDVMPTLAPPGVHYATLNDSGGLSNVGPIEMQDNPNGQSVGLSSFAGSAFSARPYDT